MKVENKTDQNVVLKLEKVTKQIGKQTIVNQLSFSIKKGEIVGLLGPNGAGKTTTIRMIVGLIGMTEGDVIIQGSSIKNQFTKAIRHVGAIVENPEFYPYMSGLDNLKQYQRMTDGITDERLNRVVELVGLKDAMNKRVKAYSLGMRQRLGIAQALLHEPSILILDEPTNGLDPAGIREMRDYLKQIAREEGIAILVSSHLLSEMELTCSRVVVIQQGKFVTERVIGEMNASAKTSNERTRIMLRVNDAAAAAGHIRELKGISIESINRPDNELILMMQDKDIPDLITLLSANSLAVYRIADAKQSLEDEFLKWTGGGNIA